MRTLSTQPLVCSYALKKQILIIGFFTTMYFLLHVQTVAQSCPNVDFSMGNFTNWQGRTGTCCPINLPTLGIVGGRHTIIAAPGVDPNTGGGLVLPAPGFTRVARLGNNNTGAEAEGLSYTLLVDPTNALFIYTYACVLEEPGHISTEQPRFELQVRDQFNNIIPCTFYEVAAGNGIPGFQNFGAVIWQNWQQVGVDLSAYMGQTVTIEARTGDCSLGGHYGYAYIAGQCQPLQIDLDFCMGATSANLTAPDGFASYQWSTGQTTQNITITNPAIGQVVTCTVTSVTGCQAVLSTSLNPIQVTASIPTTTDVSCNAGSNGTATVTANGGSGTYTYAWAPTGGTNATATGLNASTYTVVVTESGNGCTASSTVTINQPLQPLTGTGVSTQINCFGGSTGTIDLTPTGGTPNYSYAWSTGATTQDIANLPAGNYNVTITDANNCTSTYTTTLTQPAAALTVTGTITPVLCFGGNTGSIDITPSGGTPGYTYVWSNGAITQDIGNLATGNYNVTVTDANGCTNNAYVATVNQPATPLTVSGTTSNVLCFGGNSGSVNITPSGGSPGYTYVWSNGANTQDINSLAIGNYNVTVTDANGCTNNQYSAIITQPAAALAVTGVTANVLCFGGNTGSVDITPSGGTPGYTYSWSNGATTQDITGLIIGNYNVTVTDANGCTNNSYNAVINQPLAPLLIMGLATDVLCFGGNSGAINITPTGGTLPYTFSWSNGAVTQNLSNLSIGNYQVTVTDGNGCTNSNFNSVVQQPLAPLTVTGTPSPVLCYGGNSGSISINSSGGTPVYTYLWNNGATTQNISGLQAGNYNVVVTDANGCTFNGFSTQVNQPASSLSVTGASTSPSCFGMGDGALNITSAGGTSPYAFSWNTGANSEDLSNIPSGNYTVLVSDANGCTVQGSWPVTDPSAINILSSQQDNSCFGIKDGYIAVNLTGGISPYSILWNTGSVNPAITNLGPGNYSVTITDSHGCTNSATYVLTTPPPIYVSVDSLYQIWLGESVELDATASGGTGTLSYSWGPENGLSCPNCSTTDASPTLNTQYGITVTDQNGCTAIDAVYIEVLFALYVPNTFTPNGDGDNDVFYAMSESVKNFSLRIFDRWGEEVFNTTSIFTGWDGVFRGVEAKQDVYVYRIEATFANGKYEELTGQVTLLR